MTPKFTRPGDDPQAAERAAGPSRTARKNLSRELQDIGALLVELKPDKLAALSLPEGLREAILEAKRTKTFGAQRRQLQLIGKLMRQLEPEAVEAARAALRAAQKL